MNQGSSSSAAVHITEKAGPRMPPDESPQHGLRADSPKYPTEPVSSFQELQGTEENIEYHPWDVFSKNQKMKNDPISLRTTTTKTSK